MKNKHFVFLAFVFFGISICSACGDSGGTMICLPNTYICDGGQGNILRRCDSSGQRLETMTDCGADGRICSNGSCISADGDSDSDFDTDFEQYENQEVDQEIEQESLACDADIDCPDNQVCVAKICEAADGVRYTLTAQNSTLIYRNDLGSLSIYNDMSLVLENAYASIMLDDTDETGIFLASLGHETNMVEILEEQDKLGLAKRLIVTVAAKDDKVGFNWIISSFENEGFFTFKVQVFNENSETIKLAKTSALVTGKLSNGGLYLGDDPKTHRIWENGSYTYLDFFANIVPGDVMRDAAFAMLVPGNFMGHSVSSWNHSVTDLASSAVWIAGALTFESSSPVINISYDPAESLMSADGRASFSFFAAENNFQPQTKPIEPNQKFSSEIYYVHASEDSVFEGLERYAMTAKKQMDIVLWQEKAPGNKVPNGWNSWSMSGTGGYGAGGINEEVILANLDVMADEFRDWGMDWFQIDDGYQPTYGDWWWRADKFPHGAKWMSDQIRSRGFKPGLWIAPFTLYKDSEIYINHPDWIAGKSDIGSFFSGGYEFFDLTKPEVLQYLHDLFTTFKNDWGFDWLKMDFSYYALFGDDFSDASKTREEAYRNALRVIRDAIGDDTFFLAVSSLGSHYGLVDADRLTLDNMPVWDMQPNDANGGKSMEQGFKPTIRTAARRYYLHNRIWINHSDLIVFRSNPNDLSWPRVTLEEAQAFCSYVALTGGIVKLGDRLVDMTAEQINSVRPLLPIYDKGARPLDILKREFPEIWHLNVDRTNDGYAENYDLIGLFNWGKNVDQSVNPYQEIADDGYNIDFDLDLSQFNLKSDKTYLAYEFWTQTFVGEFEDSLKYQVLPHTSRVIALREKTGVPQFLGFNRHLTMGASGLKSVTFDEDSMKLTLIMDVVPGTIKAPFIYKLAFYLPDAYSYKSMLAKSVSISDADAKLSDIESGKLLEITFVPDTLGELLLEITF